MKRPGKNRATLTGAKGSIALSGPRRLVFSHCADVWEDYHLGEDLVLA
jgi:hypothetical protein